jgi:hypothetical protein
MDKDTPLKVWGPLAWDFLHCITFNYPETVTDSVKKEQTKAFFNSVGHVLPCKSCGDDFIKVISENKIDTHLDSRDSLSRWFWNIHNLVNEKLGVPSCSTPTYEQVKKKYRNCGKSQITPRLNYVLLAILIVLILSISLLIIPRG